MAENSKIEWTTHTFNPWRGCTKVSAECAHCYADTLSKRNPKTLGVWGPNGTRVVAAEAAWKQPMKWDRTAELAAELWEAIGGDRSKPGTIDFEGTPAHWERPRVFCASLADVFEAWTGDMTDTQGKRLWASRCIPDGTVTEWIQERPQCEFSQCRPLTMTDVRRRLLNLICRTPNLDWLLLTKRPENALQMMVDAGLYAVANPNLPCPQPNIWIGASVGERKSIPRIDALRQVPAVVRFLSCEPLLEDLGTLDLTGISWVIVGGESGHGARPMHPDWVRSLRDQCQATGTAFFFKQFGEWVPDGSGANLSPTRKRIVIGNDGKPRVEGEPNYTACRFVGLNLVGKKAAGRLLDGREWNEIPIGVIHGLFDG